MQGFDFLRTLTVNIVTTSSRGVLYTGTYKILAYKKNSVYQWQN